MTDADPGGAPRRQLETVLEITRHLASEPRLDPLLALIARETCNLLDAERATLFLYDARTDELFSRIATESEIEEIRMPARRGIAGAVVVERAPLNIPDAYQDPRFNPDIDKQTGWRTRNILAVPMTNLEGEMVGVLEAINKRRGPFSDEDGRLLGALAAQAGVALERAQLLEGILAKGRLEKEMELARDIQIGLMPERPPAFPGYDLAGWSKPSEYAGGDFFDLFAWGEGRMGLMLGDAVGHGVGPALLAAETRALVRAAALHEPNPENVLDDANRLLAQDVAGGRFVTLALAVVDAAAGTFTYASAGHGPVVVMAADGTCRELPSTGLPLGILPEMAVERGETVPLGPGDLLLVVSDGIFECDTADGDELGMEAVLDVARRHLSGSTADLLQAIADLTESVSPDGRFRDDRTAVAAKRAAGGGAP